MEESELLIDAIEDFKEASDLVDYIKSVHELEHKGDEINHEVFSKAAVDFMPPIDREDIVELAHALDDVLDCIEDVVAHMYMYDIHVLPEDAIKFANFIKSSCKALDKAVAELRNFKESKKFKAADRRHQRLRGGGGRSVQARHSPSPHQGEPGCHARSGLVAHLRAHGECCDACEHAADIVSTIILKNM